MLLGILRLIQRDFGHIIYKGYVPLLYSSQLSQKTPIAEPLSFSGSLDISKIYTQNLGISLRLRLHTTTARAVVTSYHRVRYRHHPPQPHTQDTTQPGLATALRHQTTALLPSPPPVPTSYVTPH